MTQYTRHDKSAPVYVTTMRLKADLMEELRQYAKETNISVNSAVVDFLTDGLRRARSVNGVPRCRSHS